MAAAHCWAVRRMAMAGCTPRFLLECVQTSVARMRGRSLLLVEFELRADFEADPRDVGRGCRVLELRPAPGVVAGGGILADLVLHSGARVRASRQHDEHGAD